MRIRQNGRLCLRVIFTIFLCLISTEVLSQEGYDTRAHYDKAEYMVAMRDGVKLYTQVYIPKDNSQKYPIILFRTPYSVRYYGPNIFAVNFSTSFTPGKALSSSTKMSGESSDPRGNSSL